MAGQTYQYNLQFIADVTKAKNEINNLQKQLSAISSFSGFSGLGQKLSAEMKEGATAALELQSMLQNAFNVNTGKLDLSRFNDSLKKSGKTLKDYQTSLGQLGPEGQRAFYNLALSIQQAEIPLRRTNALFDKMWVSLKQTARYQLSNAILGGFTRSIRDAFEYSKELNASLNDIRIVTGYGVDKMADFAAEANKAAKALSTTTTEYTKASLIYYQQGLSDQQVKERTDITVKMANVTGETAQEVSQQMTAVWNNFYDGSKSLEYYADVLTKLGAATASSTDEISQGLEKFAATADAIGLSYEYSTAALATVTAQTRQSADVVGTAFKTMFARIQGLKLGETLDDGTTLNQYSQALAKIGVNIQDSNGNLKDMDSILDDMGEKWNNLNQAEKVATAQQVAGLRQYNQLMALMENWDFFQKNLKTAESATGELQNQADIYAESWEAASNRVRASVETIFDSLLNDEFIIKMTNGLADILENVNLMIKGFGGLKGTLSTIGLILTQVFNKQIIGVMNNMGYNLTSMFIGQKGAQNLQRQANSVLKEAGDYDSQTGIAIADSSKYVYEYKQKLAQVEAQLTEEGKIQANIMSEQLKTMSQQLIQEGQILDQERERQKVTKQNVITETSGYGYGEKATNAVTDQMEKYGTLRGAIISYRTTLQDSSIAEEQKTQILERLKIALSNSGLELEEFSMALQEGSVNSRQMDSAIDQVNDAIQETITTFVTSSSMDDIPNAQLNNINNALRGVATSFENTVVAEQRFEGELRKGQQTSEQYQKQLENLNVKTLGWAGGIMLVSQSLMALNSLINSVEQVINAFGDKEMSGWDKFKVVLSAIASTLPMITMMINKDTAATLKNTLAKQINAATQSKFDKQGLSGPIKPVTGDSMTKGQFWGQLGKNIGAIALITAGLTIVTKTIEGLVNWYNRVENKAKELKETSDALNESLQAQQQEYDDLINSLNSLEEQEEALRGLKVGTDEWRDALRKCNEEVLGLIEKYPELSKYVETTANNQMTISEEGQEYIKRQERETLNNAQRSAQVATQTANEAKIQADKKKIAKDVIKSDYQVDPKDVGMGAGVGVGVGVGVGLALLGLALAPFTAGTSLALSAAGGKIAAIGAGVGLAAGGIAGGVTAGNDRTSNAEVEALNKLQAKYEKIGEAAFDDSSLKEVANGNASLEKELKENRKEVRRLITNNQALIDSNNALNEQIGMRVGEGNKAYDDFENKEALNKYLGEVVSNQANDLYDKKYKDMSGGLTDAEIQRRYAEMRGWDPTLVKNLSGNKAEYVIDDQGTTKVISDEVTRKALALADAEEDVENKDIKDLITKLVDNAELISKDAEKGQDALASFMGGKAMGDLSSLTQDELKALSKNIDTIAKDYANMGYDTEEAFKDALKHTLDSTENQIKEFKNKLDDDLTQEDLTLLLEAGIDYEKSKNVIEATLAKLKREAEREKIEIEIETKKVEKDKRFELLTQLQKDPSVVSTDEWKEKYKAAGFAKSYGDFQKLTYEEMLSYLTQGYMLDFNQGAIAAQDYQDQLSVDLATAENDLNIAANSKSTAEAQIEKSQQILAELEAPLSLARQLSLANGYTVQANAGTDIAKLYLDLNKGGITDVNSFLEALNNDFQGYELESDVIEAGKGIIGYDSTAISTLIDMYRIGTSVPNYFATELAYSDNLTFLDEKKWEELKNKNKYIKALNDIESANNEIEDQEEVIRGSETEKSEIEEKIADNSYLQSMYQQLSQYATLYDKDYLTLVDTWKGMISQGQDEVEALTIIGQKLQQSSALDSIINDKEIISKLKQGDFDALTTGEKSLISQFLNINPEKLDENKLSEWVEFLTQAGTMSADQIEAYLADKDFTYQILIEPNIDKDMGNTIKNRLEGIVDDEYKAKIGIITDKDDLITTLNTLLALRAISKEDAETVLKEQGLSANFEEKTEEILPAVQSPILGQMIPALTTTYSHITDISSTTTTSGKGTDIYNLDDDEKAEVQKRYTQLDKYDKELEKIQDTLEETEKTFSKLTGDNLFQAFNEYSQQLKQEEEILAQQLSLYESVQNQALVALGDYANYTESEFEAAMDGLSKDESNAQLVSDLQYWRNELDKTQESIKQANKALEEIGEEKSEIGIKRIKEEFKELIDFDNYDTFFDSWQGFEKQLKDISKELDNIGKKLERTVDLEGRNTLRAEERAKLQEEITKNEEKAGRKGKELEEVKAEARDIYNNTIQKDLYNTYGDYGLPELNADFSNIDEYVTVANEKYAEYQRQWKLASEDERKTLEETEGMFWEGLKKYIDNTFSTIIKLEEDIDAANSEAEENRIKIYDSYTAEVLDGIEEAEKLAEESLKRLDYRRSKYNSENVFAASELFYFSLEELNNQYNILETIKAERAELEKRKEAGEIDSAAYEEALKTIDEKTYTALENIRNLNTELSEGLPQALSKAASLIDSELSKFETLDELLAHYETSLELLNRDKEYQTIIKLTEASMENALTELELQKRTLAALEPEKEALEKTLAAMSPTDENYWNIKTQLDQITDLYNDTNSKILSLIEEAAEKANKILETKMEEAADTFNRAISGEVSIDSFINKLDLMTEAQEKYFDKTNQIYETNALLRKAQQAFDKTDSKMAKEKLLGFSKTVEQLKNQNKLSKFELEAAQKRFEILQAEIALKDAEDAKSQVRLMRNAAGGYSYVFTADEEATEEARQNLDDKNNDYYNFLKDSRADAEKEWYENALRAQEAIAEVDQNWIDGMYKTEQEYEDERAQVQSYWIDRMYQDSKTFGLILEANGEDVSMADEMWRRFRSNFDTYMDSNTTSIEDWKDDTSFVLDEIGKNSEKTGKKINEVVEAGDELAKELNATLFPALDAELKKIQDLVAEYDKLKASKQALVFDAEVATGNAGKAFGYEENKDYMNEALKALAKNDVATAKLLAAQRALKLSDLKKQGKEIKEGNFTQEHLISLIENGKESDFKLLAGIVDQPDEILKRFEGSLFKKDTLNSLGDVYDAAYYGCIDIQEKAKELTGQEIETLDGNTHWLIENEAEFFGAQYTTLFGKLEDIKGLLQALMEEEKGYTYTYNESSGHLYESDDVDDVLNGLQGTVKGDEFIANDGSGTTNLITGKVTSTSGSRVDTLGVDNMTSDERLATLAGLNALADRKGSLTPEQQATKDRIEYLEKFNTGGYTGSWGSEGRLAILHQKELVLNARDTENMLDMISIVRDFSKAIDMQALMAAMPTQLSMASRLNPERDKLQQQVSIQATFPNVQDHNEIEEAFNNLINTAAQYANR